MHPTHGNPVSLDLDRARRCGFPEVVYGEGKSVSTLTDIFRQLLADGVDVLATRIAPEKAAPLLATYPAGVYNELARTFRVRATSPSGSPGQEVCRVAVISAGTSDLPVAEEAAKRSTGWASR